MKKAIGIGIGLIFILSILLGLIMNDTNFAFQISIGIGIVYFILLTIYTYIKNLYSYFKTGKFPSNANLAIIVIGFLAFTSNKDAGTSLVMVEGAYNSAMEFNKTNNKLGIFTYTLFYISLWSFLVFVFRSFVFQTSSHVSINETLLTISFASLVVALFIIMIVGIFRVAKGTKKIMQDKEKEYQQLKKTNALAYDLKSFKRHYGSPYYILAYIVIINMIIFFGVFSLYRIVFNSYIPEFIVFIPYLISGFGIIYLIFFFPVIIHTMKMNSKRQLITLNPLRIRMIPKDGYDVYAYVKIEKNYLVNVVESYSVTNRWVIINGQIESSIRKTINNSIKGENKTITKLRIPRVFSNENILIDYLEQFIKKENNFNIKHL